MLFVHLESARYQIGQTFFLVNPRLLGEYTTSPPVFAHVNSERQDEVSMSRLMAQCSHQSRLFIALRRAAPAMFLVLSSCSDPRGVDPAPLAYRLYFGMHGAPATSQAWVRALDCKTNAVTDSFSYAGMSRQVLDVLFSAPPYPNGFMDIGVSL